MCKREKKVQFFFVTLNALLNYCRSLHGKNRTGYGKWLVALLSSGGQGRHKADENLHVKEAGSWWATQGIESTGRLSILLVPNVGWLEYLSGRRQKIAYGEKRRATSSGNQKKEIKIASIRKLHKEKLFQCWIDGSCYCQTCALPSNLDAKSEMSSL